ncbi:MAG: D-cysteine desulfhydrase family protein [Peptoniphilus sp.]|nr:D-cysteine desulfhydrase family protein [Peptoniphilus sp.]MDD7362776.1 D-cysteine desulfhydrase family protein [Bacillota bacterium]MDY6044032.1 D-cysteine desulfhydrase family protein [Peptoniphilus sp.]
MKKLSLANTPTRIEEIQLMDADLPARLFVKRDDMTGVAVTGNKIRKLEYLLQKALDDGATDVITRGAIQSNHTRATAMVCARLGIKCHVLLQGPRDADEEGNYFLDRLAGADIRIIDEDDGDPDEAMRVWKENLDREGATTMIIPMGGSDGLGCLGYVDCFDEILEQEEEMGVRFDTVVAVAGSGGMLSGLVYGNALSGAKKDIVGISVLHTEKELVDTIIPSLVDEMNKVSGKTVGNYDVTVIDDYVGLGYAKSRPEEMEFIWDFVSQTGIILDPVYTGKAMYGTFSELMDGHWKDKENILFIHSGGAFGWTKKQIEMLLRK